MQWTVEFYSAFKAEYDQMPETIQDQILKGARLLVDFGPSLGRPHVDTLAGSKYTNMKELRFKTDDGVWRLAFAFDPERKAVLLVASDKSGISQSRFYKTLIQKADERFEDHLNQIVRR